VNAVDQSFENLQAHAAGLPGLERFPVGLHLSPWLIAGLLVICFALAYKVLPHVGIPAKYALCGGLVGGGLWTLGKTYYVWYLENVSRLGPLYGSLGAVILTLIWVYVSSLIFLFGAELTCWLVRTDPRRPREEAAVASPS
jgi:YihY family inner membrane protein